MQNAHDEQLSTSASTARVQYLLFRSYTPGANLIIVGSSVYGNFITVHATEELFQNIRSSI